MTFLPSSNPAVLKREAEHDSGHNIIGRNIAVPVNTEPGGEMKGKKHFMMYDDLVTAEEMRKPWGRLMWTGLTNHVEV